MSESEKKVIDSTAELISSLAKKMKDVDVNAVKKLAGEENASVMGLIVCCTSTTAHKEKKTKNKGKK